MAMILLVFSLPTLKLVNAVTVKSEERTVIRFTAKPDELTENARRISEA